MILHQDKSIVLIDEWGKYLSTITPLFTNVNAKFKWSTRRVPRQPSNSCR